LIPNGLDEWWESWRAAINYYGTWIITRFTSNNSLQGSKGYGPVQGLGTGDLMLALKSTFSYIEIVAIIIPLLVPFRSSSSAEPRIQRAPRSLDHQRTSRTNFPRSPSYGANDPFDIDHNKFDILSVVHRSFPFRSLTCQYLSSWRAEPLTHADRVSSGSNKQRNNSHSFHFQSYSLRSTNCNTFSA